MKYIFLIFLFCVACTSEIAEKAKFKTVYLHAQTGSIEIFQGDLGVIFEVKINLGLVTERFICLTVHGQIVQRFVYI